MDRNMLKDPVVTQFTTDQTPGLAAVQSPGRLVFADHLKVALIILVVLHHLSVIYAANTPFYYLEPAYGDVAALLILVIFQLINQAYFMGFFFLLSGYFSPGSYDRKGLARFLKDRLLRLGIPLVVFMFVLNPLASTGIWYMPSSLTGITTPLTWQQYPGLIKAGPLWFIAMLLIFDFGYAAWRLVRRNRAPRAESDNRPPSYLALGIFILALALASYLVRIVAPLGKYILHFPSLAYLPQYLSFFLLGAVASRRDWLRTIPNSTGRAGFIAALVATILLFPIALRGGAGFLGGGTWQLDVRRPLVATVAVGTSGDLEAATERGADVDALTRRIADLEARAAQPDWRSAPALWQDVGRPPLPSFGTALMNVDSVACLS